MAKILEYDGVVIGAGHNGMIAEKGVTSAQSLVQHYGAWENAMHRTPHGKPIELRAEDFRK